MTVTVSIIGKPNVGKSTLFNKLCGRRMAITGQQPGTTRDYKLFDVDFCDLKFKLIDTAGLEATQADDLARSMSEYTLGSANISDIILFVVDARAGLTIDDIEFARKVRKFNKKIILVANKAEGKSTVAAADLYKLGFGEPVFISSEHNLGFCELHEALQLCISGFEEQSIIPQIEVERHLKLVILGRANVGKSTLFNTILGFDRSIVSNISGTTRDSITHVINVGERTIELVDTAGMRKKNKIQDKIEELSVAETIHALRKAHVAALIIDATQPIENQDLSIANLIVEEGKAMILVVNKYDLIEDKKAFLKSIKEQVEDELFKIKGVQIVVVSALQGYNIDSIFKSVFEVEKYWKKQITTAQLNRWLRAITTEHMPPLSKSGRRIKLKYIVQTAIKPPTFVIFSNTVKDLPKSYTKFLEGSLREGFSFYGVPIRIKYKKGENPYLK